MNERTRENRQLTKARLHAAVVLALLFLLAVSTANSTELLNNWYSTRALGMGNAYTAVVDDADALFYNPAALQEISGVNWTVFDIHGGLNGQEAIDNAKLAEKIADDIAGTVEKLYGKRTWAGAGAKSAISVPGFAAAVFGHADAGVVVSNPPNPMIQPNFIVDYGGAIGFAVPLIPKVATIGLVGKRINRTGTTKALGGGTLASLDGESLKQEFKRRGTGYGLDLGAKFKLPGPVSPALTFVMRDIGYTAFTHEEGLGPPPRSEPEMVIGGSLQISAPLITITPAFDFRYLNRSDVQLGKKINLGVEVDLPLLDLRVGLHQGYYTAGVGLDFALLRADVATWGVELGEYPGQREDRRYMAQLTFEIGFDPFFFFGGSSSGGGGGAGGKSGERRRLKQRR